MAPQHKAACIDEEGKVECICGLEDANDQWVEEQLGKAEALGYFDQEGG